jgi:ABC-2 type transport system permease protein
MTMQKTLRVLRNEITSTFARKSFLFTAFGLPLVAVLVFLGVSVLKGNSGGAAGVPTTPPEQPDLQVEGYVDRSGLITAPHADIPAGILVPYADEVSAHQALAAGDIAAYYIISADYVETGELIYINPDYVPLSSPGQSWVMRQTIFANLLGNDAERIDRAGSPMELTVRALSASQVQRDQDDPLTFWLPYAAMMLLYLVILMSATLLLNSVGDEKKNRVMEILLLSVSPRQLLAGKIVGLGIVGLLQAVIWVGTAYTLLRVSGRTFSLPAEFQLPVSLLVWGVVFFLLGYAIYASLMAGLGALAPNLQAASQATIVVIWPLILPMLFIVSLVEDTHGALATGFSLFPLTAPVAMVVRLAVGGVPAWQPVLAVGLLLVTAFFIVRAVAAMFHAQTLLSGQTLSVRGYYQALLGRGVPAD